MTRFIAALLGAAVLAGGVAPGVTAKANSMENLWDQAATLPTQAETQALTPATIRPGEKAKVAGSYTFQKDAALFSLPIHIGDNPQVFIKITLSGFTKGVWVRAGGWMTQNQGNGETTSFTLRQKDGKEQKLMLLKDVADAGREGKVEVTLYQYKKTAASKTKISAGRWAEGYHYNGACLFQVNAPSDGIIKIESGQDPNEKNGQTLNLSTTLLNSKKKTISDAQMSGDGAQYCVKKGTYYLKASNTDGMVKLRYKFTKVTSAKNTSRTKAANLKKGKQAKGFLPAGQSKNDSRWYKIVITKKRKVSVTAKSLAVL